MKRITNLLTPSSDTFFYEETNATKKRGRKKMLSKFEEDEESMNIPIGISDCATTNNRY